MEKALGVCKKNVKGAILERGLERFTKLSLFFPVIKDEILNYNWLLTDIDADYYSDSLKNNHYELISGEKFMQLIEGDQFTFVWGVFSAIPKQISIEKIIEEQIPYANGYEGFWNNPVSIQNSVAVIEMVLWDGTAALIISKSEHVINKFIDYYKFSKLLEDYNEN